MDLKVLLHEKSEFYPTYVKWCEMHDFPPMIFDCLPNTVFVCYSLNVPVYCVWLWNTDSGICWIGFLTSNKQVEYTQREGGIALLIEESKIYAKSVGYNSLFITSGDEIIIKELEKSGFVEADVNINQYYFNV